MDTTTLKGLTVLEALVRSGESRSAGELAQELGLVRSNVHRTLQTLAHAGYVEAIADSAKYRPTLRLWELGNVVVQRFDIRKQAYPTMQALAAHTGETILLAVRQRLEVCFLDKIQTEKPVGTFVLLGARAPVHCTAPGKAILSRCSHSELLALPEKFERYTAKTITTRDALIAELAIARERGYAINTSEWREGVNSLGVPITAPGGEALGAISVTGPDTRVTLKKLDGYAPVLVEAARELSRRIGG
ncbi:IclR family transcriptional regulator [Bordetella parapertussis]|uniref:IclR-family regulatory protein n=3 Tax=Bordetella TaxID=517 RepID=A0A0H3LQ95_BORBR|nr:MULTISPECIES: IclR family transcriptional regulator [Bordetella]KAK67044.1 transcriptional regulator, IclR family, C-terminal domain protein [Bordetella bronchiseptica 980-2]KDD61593.1 transcriptional regulator, IclR family, C-terminal domain protein [Bordetella bronchiseptica OSU553]AMG89221.1 IclR family transcriptional regulator [Bordetella bronchiseptica]AOB40087.1 IclR family transcriptional regulator [Bordetella parapertussis]AUL44103.1 IclR family transcriptional regulator [Bordetell